MRDGRSHRERAHVRYSLALAGRLLRRRRSQGAAMTERQITEGTINCRLCGASIAVKFRRGPDAEGHMVSLNLVDHAPMAEHLDSCPGVYPPAEGQPKGLHSELVGRIQVMLDGGHYVSAAGSGACTMCGTTRDGCYARLRKLKDKANPREPVNSACCGACGNGNTHPAPGETWDCQVWGAQHGAKS